MRLYPLHETGTVYLSMFTTFLFGFIGQTHKLIRWMKYSDVFLNIPVIGRHGRVSPKNFQSTCPCVAEWVIFLNKITTLTVLQIFAKMQNSSVLRFLNQAVPDPTTIFRNIEKTLIFLQILEFACSNTGGCNFWIVNYISWFPHDALLSC